MRNLVKPIIRAFDPAVLRARVDGRSYWQVRYRDGHVVNEYDGVDWLDLPQRRQGSPVVEARLVCPDGSVGVLGNSESAEGRFFQFKIGEVRVGEGRRTTAHVLGYLTDTEGRCRCYAWEWPGRMVEFWDRFPNMEYGGPVTMGMQADVLGVPL